MIVKHTIDGMNFFYLIIYIIHKLQKAVVWGMRFNTLYTENQRFNINSLRPSDAVRRQGTESTLAQVMACWLTAPSHYLNHVDISSVRSCGIHQSALSWEDLNIPISKTRLKSTFLESHSDLPGANELTPFSNVSCKIGMPTDVANVNVYLRLISG